MNRITVFTTPNCPKCTVTKKAFERAGVEYEEEPITDELAEEFKARGFKTAPVVRNEHGRYVGWWSGYRDTKIRNAIRHRREERERGEAPS